MKTFKKLAGMILAVCLMVPMFSTLVFAAEGTLMFSDPSTKVGENVNIDLVVKSSSGTVGNVNVTMSYDTSALEFVSGDGFSADGSGSLTYTGTGSSSELRSTMTFRALKQTSTQLTVSSSSASLSTGDTLNLDQGSSAITIAAADDGTTSVEPSGTATAEPTASTDVTVSVNGTDYNFSEAFTTSDVPEGYSETTMTFNGEERKFVSNEAGVTLGYLVDSSGAGSFFLFNSEDATFLPFAQVTISDTTSLIPLNDEAAVKLPENYETSTLTVQGYDFTIWSDPVASDRFYVIYALNTRTNTEGLYQYDSEDGTYQYFEAPADTEDETSDSGLPGKIGQFISDHIMVVMVAAALVFLILLILMIVFAVKLVHRNQELDDLYDEYDIPYDDEDDTDDKTSKKLSEKNTKSKSNVNKDDEYDDEYDDEDAFEDDDEYDDEYDDDEYDDEADDEYDDDDDDKDYDINFIDV